jgi:hypothetical protein
MHGIFIDTSVSQSPVAVLHPVDAAAIAAAIAG